MRTMQNGIVSMTQHVSRFELVMKWFIIASKWSLKILVKLLIIYFQLDALTVFSAQDVITKIPMVHI